MMKGIKRNIWRIFTGIFLALCLLVTNVSVANASDLITANENSFHTRNDLQIKSVYSPMHYEVSEGVTVEKDLYPEADDEKYLFKNLRSDSVVRMTWDEVGTYRGKKVGVTLSFSDFVVPYGYQDPIVACNHIDYFVRGYNYWCIQSMDTEYVFFYTDTGHVIDIGEADAERGTYLTFSSLNIGEFVSPKDTSKDGYISKNTVVKKQKMNIKGVDRTVFVGTSNDGWTDVVGGEGFEKSSVAIPLSGESNIFTVGQTGAAGYYYIWSYPGTYFVYLPEPEAPVKTVNGKTDYEADYEGEEITYEVAQKTHILGEDIIIKYDSLVFQDQLPKEVTYLSGEMLDGSGNIVSSGILQYDAGKHMVTYTFSQDYLKNEMPYDGNAYTLKIHCKIREGVTESFENHAQVSFNDIPVVSNTVSVIPALSRSITVTKRIQSSEINFANGTPTFFFTLNGTEKNGEAYQQYQMVSFDKEYVEAHTDSHGWVEKSCTFSDLQRGTYFVQEESCSRYRLTEIKDIISGTLTGSINDDSAKVKFQLTGMTKSGTAVFQNEKYEWGFFTGSDSCVNQIGTP